MGTKTNSARDRIRTLFLNNIGQVVTRAQIVAAANGEVSGKDVENWHQRLSELRTDEGYTILTNRDRSSLKPGQYLMETNVTRQVKKRRYDPATKAKLIAENPVCQWPGCGLREGTIDPVGGGTVRLQMDHVTPHNMDSDSPVSAEGWQLLCGRHQVMKKNFWDDATGKLNIIAILQAATWHDKQEALRFLETAFADRKKK